MNDEPRRAFTRAPAVSKSLMPSDIPDTALPYGKPPVKLVEIESSVSGISRELRDRVRALAENANKIRYRSPVSSAVCWSEAGRLLDRRAGRTAEAWVCYNRALSIFPDHKPALAALRRLARRAQSAETLIHVLEANLERSSSPAEKAALWTELAVLELKRGNPGRAMDALRGAAGSCPEAVLPHIVKIGVAAREKNDEELTESLDVLADRWPRGDFSRDLPLALALIDERLGRLDAGLKRLDKAALESELSMAGQWARLRLCLRLGRPEEAALAIDEILENTDNQPWRPALNRLRAAVGCFVLENSGGGLSAVDSRDPVWDIELLHAARTKDRAREVRAASEAKLRAMSPLLKEALAVTEMTGRRDTDEKPTGLDSSINPLSAIGRATASFLGIDSHRESEKRDSAEKTESAAARLNGAIAGEGWERAASELSALREKANDERDRWALAVAESALLIHHLTKTDAALTMLRGETDRLNRAPLPALVRSYDARHESLAELAVSEAEDSSDDAFKAWRFGWAGLHTESVDRNEAGRLYLRSLALKPDLQFSLNGLARTVSDRSVLGEAYYNAAEVAKDLDQRVQYLIAAGMHYIAQGAGSRAVELLGEALDMAPDDRLLRNSVVRLALTHPEAAVSDYVEPTESAEDASLGECFAFGALALEVDPNAAVHWFKKALDEKPDDPVAAAGLREALLKARQSALIAEDFSSRLAKTASPISKAIVLQRLSHIYRWWEEDSTRFELSLKSLDETLPGHRSTLARLAKHYLVNRQQDDLQRVFAGLFRTAADEEDAGAFASAAWKLRQSDKEILRFAVEKHPMSLLELAELESIEENPEERKKLLDAMVKIGGGRAIHLSRLAKTLAETGDPDRAEELHEQVVKLQPFPLFDLFALAAKQTERKEYAKLVDTLSKLADAMTIVEYKVEYLSTAIDIARSQLSDFGRATRLCLQVLQTSPQNAYAYITAREMLGFRGGEQVLGSGERPLLDDRDMIMELINMRLGSAGDQGERRELHLEMARVLLESGDTDERDDAKKHIDKALKMLPDDMAAHRWLADIHRGDGEWTEAIEHMMNAARLVDRPETGIEVFYALGELYMDHSEQDDFAEKSFLKVLSWDRSHKVSLERISELYVRMGNFSRAAKALEHLIKLTEEPSKKLPRMVQLAEMLDKHLNRSKEGEKLLIEARRVDPFAFEPVEALAELYRSQRDPIALSIHLDGVLTALAAALVDKPDQKDIYRNIWKVLAMKGDEGLAGIAVEAMRIVGVSQGELPPNAVETKWDAGVRVGDPSYSEYICTKAVPAGLRQTIKAVEEPLARLASVSAKQIGVDKSARLHRNNQLVETLSDLADGFGIEAPAVYPSNESMIKIAPGSPPSVFVPKGVAETEDIEVNRYVACYCLQMIGMGLCIATMVSPEVFRRLLAGVVRLSLKDFTPHGMTSGEVESQHKRIRDVVTSKTIDQIRPFAFDCTDSINREGLIFDVIGVGIRSGFIGSGSLSAAVKAMRMIAGRSDAPLSRLQGAGPLMAYIFSKDHIELRARMGK